MGDWAGQNGTELASQNTFKLTELLLDLGWVSRGHFVCWVLVGLARQ
jgi:hypothetical protein